MNLILKDIIIINNDYLNYLRNSDSKVLINHNEGVERPNISVLVDDNGQLWAIPMTSNKRLKENNDAFFNLIDLADSENQKKGALQFFNMIPITEDTYKSALKVYSNNQNYVSLLKKEQYIIQNNLPEITKRFSKALRYSKVYKKLKEEGKDNLFYKNYLDFDLLIDKSKNWSLVHKLYIFLDSYTKLSNTNLKTYKAFNQSFNTIQNIKYEDVFRFSNSLTDAYNRFSKYSKYIIFINNSIREQELKKIIPPIIKSFNEYEEIIKQKEKSKNKDYERER